MKNMEEKRVENEKWKNCWSKKAVENKCEYAFLNIIY